MFAIVPLICLMLIFFCFRIALTNARLQGSWRISFLAACLVWGLLVVVITETLSIFNLIVLDWLLGTWTAVAIIAFAVCLTLIAVKKPHFGFKVSTMPWPQIILILGVVSILATVAMIGLVAPPNDFDSMTYHMGRVVHWIQNRNVAFYPTHTLEQLHMAPWAEYAVLNIQILAGGDRFVNLIQWFSMLGWIVGGSLIAERLGANLNGQVFAAVACATIPMGIIQASSTKNDCVVSFWLTCFVCFIMLLRTHQSLRYALATGASLGLALLTKETAYIFAFPFVVWCGFSLLGKLRWKSWKPAVLIVVVMLSVNLAQYTRNFELYKNPLGPFQQTGGGFTYSNEIFTPPAIISNLVRNISLHMNVPFPEVNEITESLIRGLHKYLQIDVNDRRTTFSRMQFGMYGFRTWESNAGNPVHLVLIVGALAFLASTRRKHSRDVFIYSIAVTAGFVLFCVYLKWQPWHSRLHLPLFVLWCPIIGVALSRINNRRISFLIVIAAMLSALPAVLQNESRPIIGAGNIFNMSRMDQYFVNRARLRDPYVSAANYVKSIGCSDVGLYIAEPLEYEYPLWVLLKDDNDAVCIEHVNVTNVSAVKSTAAPFSDFVPCAIIYIKPGTVFVVGFR